MRRPLSLAALVLCLALPASALASSGKPSTAKPPSGSNQVHVGGYYRKDGTYVPPHDRAAPHSSTSTHPGTGAHGCKNCPRDEHGRIQRSQAAKDKFMRQTGYPHGRPGYVVDHIVPLECGGADDPGNMQWQTVAEAKAKDRTERNCRK